MGMFDYIRCDVPLPDRWQPIDLQTKDFHCEMLLHIISKDGRLILDCGHSEEVPLLERPSWNPVWGDSEEARHEHPLEALCGCMRRIPKYVDANYHGIVRFYGTERGTNKWHEYNAKFTDGQLVGIECVKDE